MPTPTQQKVAVSYAWKEEDNGVNAGAVEEFCTALRQAGVDVVRDVDRLKPGQCISEFMRGIGASDFLCVFLSDAYLRSPNCMYELLVAWQRSKENPDEFRQRVKTWVMPGGKNIHTIKERAEFLEYWLSQKKEVEPLIAQYATKGMSGATVDEFRRIVAIGNEVEPMLQFFADTLSPGSPEEFQAWIGEQFPNAAPGLTDEPLPTPAAASPFHTAAMMPAGHPSYIPRGSDDRLGALLRDPRAVCIAISGDFEIGKSSLMERAGGVVGSEWIVVDKPLGLIRSHREDLSVEDFFEFFQPCFGPLNSWQTLSERVAQRPTLLLLDDLGELLGPGARALLPRLIRLALEPRGGLRVVATLPMRINDLLRERGIAHPQLHQAWQTVVVEPFNDAQARRLFTLLPDAPRAVTEHRFNEIQQRTGLKPRPLQCLADRLWQAHREGADAARLAALVSRADSYE